MSKKKILVIEDDADVRLGYQVLLKANHYDAFFAADAISAVSEARLHQPDVIILDLGLPAGDGFVVLERLQTNTTLSMIPVIVVSARDPHANKERALKAGARLFYRSRGTTMIYCRSSASSSARASYPARRRPAEAAR